MGTADILAGTAAALGLALYIGTIVWVATMTFIMNMQFRYGKNPYRRWCRKCGQQQDYMTFTWDTKVGWWEDMVTEGADPACKCHTYSDYKG